MMKSLAIVLLSASAIFLGGAEFSLKNGQNGKFCFDAPTGKNVILFCRARLKIPAPHEGWGTHALQVKLNGKTLSGAINKESTVTDPQSCPMSVCPTVVNGRFFIKADSDWDVFNAGDDGTYRNTWLLNQVNKTELSNRFYSFAFKLENLKAKNNTIDFRAFLPPQLAAYPVEISGVAVHGFGDQLIFSRDWLQAVYPWSFPDAAELAVPETVMAKNEHGFAAFTIHCFAPQQFTVPAGAQFYRLDNSNIPAKLKEAAKRHIPNIGAPYVPELFTPLAAGSKIDLPVGSTTFAARFFSEKPGSFAIAGTPLKFNVLDVTLPDAGELPVQNSMYIMASGTDTQKIYPEFRNYGMSFMLMSPWAAPIPLKIVDGKLVADFRKFDARIKMFQNSGMNKRVLFFGTSEPILRNITRLTGETEEGKEFQKRFKEFIVLFFNHTDELGIPIYLSLYDEANFQKAVWGKTKLLTSIAVTVPNSRMWSTVTELASAAHYYEVLGYRRGRDMCITHPFQTYGRSDDDTLNGVLSPDKKISELRGRFFGEYEGITSYPGTNNRYAYGVRAWQGKIKFMMGFAFWWGNMRKENVVPTKRYYVCYPFREKTTGVRYSSIGWEAIRTGIDDMRCIVLAQQILETKYGRKAAEQRLNRLFGAPRYSAAGLSPAALNDVRLKLFEIILEK